MNHGPHLEEIVGAIREELALGREPGGERIGAMFLGPQAENEDVFARLALKVISSHSFARRIVSSKDKPWVNPSSDEYRETLNVLETSLYRLMVRLGSNSIPWYSYRYKAHMTGDYTLPAALGYLAGMVYNQNNVAAEGSPVTTAIEITVAEDLWRMVGGAAPTALNQPPWGHITCDGTVANIEALWAHRNVKLYPHAVREAIDGLQTNFPRVVDLDVEVPGSGRKRLVDLDSWQMLNVPASSALDLLTDLKKAVNGDEEALATVDRHSVQRLGLIGVAEAFQRRYGGAMSLRLAYLGSATAHYSMPKASSLLGLGSGAFVPVPVQPGTARMDIDALQRRLQGRFAAGDPVIAVVAVMGSTGESAVDPLGDILHLREKFRKKGFDFAIHADAAWGGYFASLLREPMRTSEAWNAISGESVSLMAGDAPALAVRQIESEDGYASFTFNPGMTMSDYVERHLSRLAEADSITIDPHKAGFVPYPAGALLYRDGRIVDMVAFKAPVVYRDGDEPTVGVFGVEGSKPGAAATATWLSHRVVRPDRSGYGRILGRCLFNAKRMFAAIASMQSEYFVVEHLQAIDDAARGLLAEQAKKTPNAELWRLFNTRQDQWKVFREYGPDLVILMYAFNLKMEDKCNTDLDVANRLNRAVFKRLSLESERDTFPDLFITASELDPRVVGQDVVRDFGKRLGLATDGAQKMDVLISTVLDPFVTDAGGNGTVNVIPTLIDVLQAVVEEEAEKLRTDLQKGATSL